MIGDLATYAPDLTEFDALRLMLTVEHGYAYRMPKLALLVDLAYLWEVPGQHVLYPSAKGRYVALRVAQTLHGNAVSAGSPDDVHMASARVQRIAAECTLRGDDFAS